MARLTFKFPNSPPPQVVVPSAFFQKGAKLFAPSQVLAKDISPRMSVKCLLFAEFFNDSCYSAEVRYKAESLWRPTTRIADVCVKHEGLCAIMHDLSVAPQNANTNSNNNNQDDTSISASDRLKFLVHGSYLSCFFCVHCSSVHISSIFQH